MAETTNYQCPNCNGRLSFSSESGKLQCEFCESAFDPQEIEAIYAEKQEAADEKAAAGRASASEGASAAEASTSDETRVKAKHEVTGDPVQDYLANARWDDSDVENMRAYNCPSCGAQLMVDQVTAVTSCPYCGNNTVVPGQLSDVLKPDLVIPFKLDKNAAIAALKEYYGGKRFLPDGFTEGNHLEEVQGVYVPFWLYSGSASADAAYEATTSRTWSDSDNMYTETSHYNVRRAGSMRFEKVPADGSTKMPDAHMDAIEPFDYSELVPFSVAYLPGYLSDRYDLDVAQCDPRARGRVENTCGSVMLETVSGYETVSEISSSVDVDWTDISYALLPVWMLHTKWNNQDFLFAMNGQTGKLIGDLPIDPGKVRKRYLMLYLPIAIIIALIIVFVLGGYTL